MFIVGQAINGIIAFKDGCIPQYPRLYLIIDVDEENENAKILNVSSVKGKSHKLAYPSNENIINYNPPFYKPTFVKLDSLMTIGFEEIRCSCQIASNGEILDSAELDKIKGKLSL